MADWLEENDSTPERVRKFDAQYERLALLTGYPNDSLACRQFMLMLSESRGYPAIPSLRVAGTAAGWQVFLASELPIDALREAADALRRR